MTWIAAFILILFGITAIGLGPGSENWERSTGMPRGRVSWGSYALLIGGIVCAIGGLAYPMIAHNVCRPGWVGDWIGPLVLGAGMILGVVKVLLRERRGGFQVAEGYGGTFWADIAKNGGALLWPMVIIAALGVLLILIGLGELIQFVGSC